jgi:hypothetical protein
MNTDSVCVCLSLLPSVVNCTVAVALYSTLLSWFIIGLDGKKACHVRSVGKQMVESVSN